MTIRISFPGGTRVDADLGSHVVKTDQSVEHGGGATAPEPFDLLLASLATCAGFYVLAFCRTRQIPTEGIELVQDQRFDPATHLLQSVDVEIVLPSSFPEKYRSGVERAAAGCKVKKTLASPPEVRVTSRTAAPTESDAASRAVIRQAS